MMLVQSNIIVGFLTLLGCATLTTTWTNKRLQNWDDGWTHNVFGEPMDMDTACNGGQPCIRQNLTEPFPASIYRDGNVCTPSNGHHVFCNYLPENATLVDHIEFRNLFLPLNGPRPTQLLPFRSRQIDQKRSRWMLDSSTGSWTLAVWNRTRIAFSVATAPVLSGRFAALAQLIRDAMDMWTETCSDNGLHSLSLFNNWHYVNSTSALSKVNVWFYLSNGTVCNDTAAIGCSFFPYQYPFMRTTVMIDGTRLSNLNANNALLTFVHELGHLIGLAHEERNDQRKIWNATLYDSNSIMKTGVLSLRSITASDCRAIHFYDNGFGHPVSCKLHRTKGQVCTRAAVDFVSPTSVEVATGRFYWERELAATTS